MRRSVLVAVCVLVLAGGALTTADLAAGDPFVDATITNVTVTPSQPQADEPTTVTARIQNLQRSNSSLDIDAVELRASPDGGDDGTEYARAEDLGTLPPGTSIAVPLTNTFSSPGTYELRVYVIGEDEDGDQVTLQYPVTIEVVEPPSSADASITNVTVLPTQPQVGETTTLTARLQNAETSNETVDIDSVELRSSPESDDNQTTYTRAEDLGTLSPGRELAVPLTYAFQSPGVYQLRVYAEGETESGDDIEVQYPVTLEVIDSTPLVGINTQPATAGNDTQVTVTVANGVGTEMRNVEVALDSEDGSLNTSRRVASRIPSGTQRTYAFTLSDVSSGNHTLEATVTYTTDDGATRSLGQQATFQVSSSQPAGRIVLTEVEVQPRGGEVRITGSASNVGLTEASGVVLSVNETDQVQPIDPYANFFVGSVPASEFASFELSATVDVANANNSSSGNVTEIPVQVSYLVDGERRTQMTIVEYRGRTGAAAQSAAASASNQELPLTTLATAVVVALVVFGLMAFAWRNRGRS